MATRIAEAWGGNRVYNGAAWMELYWAVDGSPSGDPVWSLTSRGKIPNGYATLSAILIVNASFDSNTLDNSNTFTQNGTTWPYFSGSVSLPTVSSRTVYQQGVNVSPKFGSTTTLNIKASLTGIDRVPGTTSFTKNLAFPMRAWAAPNTPGVVSATLTGNLLRLTINGHQLTAANDRYWGATNWTIYNSVTGAWAETSNQANNKTYHEWTVDEDQYYRVGAYANNEDADTRNWTPFVTIYTKPDWPMLVVSRQSADKTKVNVTINNYATYPARHRVYRKTTANPSWMEVGSVAHGATNVYVDTVPLGTNPTYRVLTETPENAARSDYSPEKTAGDGYSAPLAPTNVAVSRIGSELRTTFSGNQTNVTADRYWAGIYLEVEKNTEDFIHHASSLTGDVTSIDTSGYGVVDNARYRTRVRAWNSAGAGPYGTSGYLYTKPAAPTAVQAARVGETDQVNISWTNNAAWPGAVRLLRSVDGAPAVLVKTLAAGTTSTTDTLATPQSAVYFVQVLTVDGSQISDASAASPLVPSIAYDKDRIPGIDAIRVGDVKVFRVMAGAEQIWLG